MEGITVREIRPVTGMNTGTLLNPGSIQMIMEHPLKEKTGALYVGKQREGGDDSGHLREKGHLGEISPGPVAPGRNWADADWVLVIDVIQEIPHWL